MRTPLILTLALCLGAAIAYVDTRPRWDDAGITAAAVFGCCLVLGALDRRYAWMVGLIVGSCVFLSGVMVSGNYGSVLAFLPAFLGAATGWGVGVLMQANRSA